MDGDDPRIDKTILDLIQTGRVKFTEKLFFELMSDYEGYRNESPFSEKITEWQDRVNFGDCSEATRKRAKRNLQKIDRILRVTPSRDRGRPPKVNSFQVYIEYRNRIAAIQSFFDKQDERPSLRLFLSAYPEYKDSFESICRQVQHRTAKAIAFQITRKRRGISIRQLRRIIAEEGKVITFRK